MIPDSLNHPPHRLLWQHPPPTKEPPPGSLPVTFFTKMRVCRSIGWSRRYDAGCTIDITFAPYPHSFQYVTENLSLSLHGGTRIDSVLRRQWLITPWLRGRGTCGRGRGAILRCSRLHSGMPRRTRIGRHPRHTDRGQVPIATSASQYVPCLEIKEEPILV